MIISGVESVTGPSLALPEFIAGPSWVLTGPAQKMEDCDFHMMIYVAMCKVIVFEWPVSLKFMFSRRGWYHARHKSVRSNSWGSKPDTDTDT